jgi:hypothetical protein
MKPRPRSLGELVASVYDQVSAMTDDTDLAGRLAAREVARFLVKCGRLDLAQLLSRA